MRCVFVGTPLLPRLDAFDPVLWPCSSPAQIPCCLTEQHPRQTAPYPASLHRQVCLQGSTQPAAASTAAVAAGAFGCQQPRHPFGWRTVPLCSHRAQQGVDQGTLQGWRPGSTAVAAGTETALPLAQGGVSSSSRGGSPRGAAVVAVSAQALPLAWGLHRCSSWGAFAGAAVAEGAGPSLPFEH